MREHGIKDFPNPEISGGHIKLNIKQGGPGGISASPQMIEAAERACRRFQQEAEESNLAPQEQVAHEEAILRFAKCMREHGIPAELSGHGAGVKVEIHGHGNPKSPASQAALKACFPKSSG